jgi:hypothetical protein
VRLRAEAFVLRSIARLGVTKALLTGFPYISFGFGHFGGSIYRKRVAEPAKLVYYRAHSGVASCTGTALHRQYNVRTYSKVCLNFLKSWTHRVMT